MLDIRYIRENQDKVEQSAKNKNYTVDVAKLAKLDDQRKELQAQADDLRRQRNELASASKGGKPTDDQITQGKELKDQLAKLESELDPIEQEYTALLKQVPNVADDDVPVGASEDENVVVAEWGEKPNFEFTPKSHWEIAEANDWIDKARAAKVAGARFAYIKGPLVELQMAIMQWVIKELSSRTVIAGIIKDNDLDLPDTPFTPILPPHMIRTDVFDAMDRLEPRDDRYQVGMEEDDLWLQGSAEHTLGSMYADEVVDELPRRFLGYATSFRREAGTYGKDTEGILRMHQFDKLEMETFSVADAGREEHKLMVAIQEHLMQQLELPYRKLQKCTADIGKPNARGVDLDAWMPGQDKYRETHTADFMSDYQSRRLNTRYRDADGNLQFVHNNDATAFALGRLMVAIIENGQTKDGDVVVPSILHPYLGRETLRS